jgi:integrase
MQLKTFIYERYWPTIKPTLSPKWQQHTEHLFKLIVGRLGEFDVSDIPLEYVDGWWSYLQTLYDTPVTPNKALVRAKHIMKVAIRWKLAPSNPFLDIRKLKEPERKFTPISDVVHETLFNDASPRLQWYLVFARYTGARLSSLAKLERRDVNLERNTVTFRRTKNGEDYTIPLHPKLRPWCERQSGQTPTAKVLPQYADPHAVSQLFRRLKKRHGVEGFRFHDFRHNVGTKLAEAGLDVKGRMQLLGHKDSRMAMRYTHIAEDVLGKAMEAAL